MYRVKVFIMVLHWVRINHGRGIRISLYDLYNDMFDYIDRNMSDSNIGGRRDKNIRNHLFIIHGIINAVVKGDAEPIDIQIYDIEKAFDALWLDECMNDMYDTFPATQHADKLALLCAGNKNNMVAINTAVGMTERIDMPRIVLQGGTWGPIKCSNSIDKIGGKCQTTGSDFYLYKKRTRIFPLGMVDDLLSVSACGHDSVAMNTYLTTQCELKKLRFHVPDDKGKTKCPSIGSMRICKISSKRINEDELNIL